MIGLARAHIAVAIRESAIDHERVERVGRRLDAWLAWVQDILFNLERMLPTTEADISALERAIDEAKGELAPLAQLIHPGGTPAAAALRVARSLALRKGEEVHALGGLYLTRLPDALFVWARWINWACGEIETPWVSTAQPPAAHR